MARPEIQNIIMKKLWDYVKSYTGGIILRKPDAELQLKLKEIHAILNPLFTKVDMSVGIHQGIKLGSPKPPNVGELKEIMSLIESM